MTAITILMNADEARTTTQMIQKGIQLISQMLLEVKTRQGYRALGYASWKAYIETEFEFSRSHAYRLLDLARVEAELSHMCDIPINGRQAQVLKQYDIELMPTIAQTAYHMAETEQRKMTSGDLKDVGEVVTTMAKTGMVDVGDGLMTAPTAAIYTERDERLQRQRQHIRDNMEIKYDELKFTAQLQLVLGDTISLHAIDFHLPDGWHGGKVEVYIKRRKAEAAA